MSKCNTVKEVAEKIADNGNENDYMRKPIGADAEYIDRSNGETVEDTLTRLEHLKLKYEDPFLILLDNDDNELSRVTIISTKHEHNYIEELTKEPTYLEKGLKTYRCACGEKYTEEIPMLSDVIKPTGVIRIGELSYTTLSNNINFNTFFNTSQNVLIEAIDNESGIKEIGYCLSNTKINNTDLSSALWLKYENSFTIEPNNQYIIYAKITDNQNNVTYINTDGIVLDNVAPIINLTNGANYQEGTVLNIEDGEILTVNGTVVSLSNNSYTFNSADNYAISVRDRAGNVSSINITIEHNYVETITKKATCTENGLKTYTCACGDSYTEAIPASGTHNFVNEVCTVCGKKYDLYETSPADAYNNWNYTLDETNKIITLNQYKGKETDVIVYGEYIVNGVKYKTKLYISVIRFFFNNSLSDYNETMQTIKFSANIDISKGQLRGMFMDCIALTSVDVSSLDTSNITDMNSTFNRCSSLTSLDLSNFDTRNVTDMWGMFYNCTSLTSLDLSNFDTRNVTDMGAMFYNCTSLTSLDLSNFDTRNVTDMNYMFNGCSNLKTIYVSKDKWVVPDNVMNMFTNCGTSEVTYK